MAQPDWQVAAALLDPVRRALYEHVRRQQHPVTREEAAEAQDISRNLAAFHLDKLVEAGLLRARYEAPTDQPRGRGRAPKVYEVASGGLMLSVPPRRYELLGELLADAVAAEPTNAASAALRLAYARGHRIGEGNGPGPAANPAVQLTAARSVIETLGFEPAITAEPGLTLGNCPFHPLAARHPELVCGLNHAFLAGLLAGIGADRLQAQLSPAPGRCCVIITPAG
ncbi:MAG TPA: helix-turn-helix domain-containing protein [Micromonosporaceae bacterium]